MKRILLILLMLATAMTIYGQDMSESQIISKVSAWKKSGDCDSVVALINANLDKFKTVDYDSPDSYMYAIISLRMCYKTLNLEDSVKQTYFKEIEHMEKKFGLKSFEYKLAISDTYYYGFSSTIMAEFIILELNPDMYDFTNEDDQFRYSRAFNWYARYIDKGISLKELEEKLQQLAQGNKYGEELMQEYLAEKKEKLRFDIFNQSTTEIKENGDYEKAANLLENNLNEFYGTDRFLLVIRRLLDIYAKTDKTDKTEQLLDSIEMRYGGLQSAEYQDVLESLYRLYSNNNDEKSAKYLELLLNVKKFDFKDEFERQLYHNYLFSLETTYSRSGKTDKAIDISKKNADFCLKYINDEGFQESYIFTIQSIESLYEKNEDWENALDNCLLLQNYLLSKKLHLKYSDEYVWSLTRSAIIYEDLNNNDKAKEQYLKRIHFYEKLQPDKEELISALTLLSGCYLEEKDYVNIEKIYVKQLALAQELYGKSNYRYGIQLLEMGEFYFDMMEDDDKAEQYLTEAKNLKSELLENKEDNTYRSILNKLGYIKLVKGEHAAGAALLEEEAQSRHNDNTLPRDLFSLSSYYREKLWSGYSIDAYIANSFACYYQNEALNRISYNEALRTKGLLLYTANSIRDAVYLSGDTALQRDWEKLEDLRLQIEILQGTNNPNEDSVKSLRYEEIALDGKITLASFAYRDLKADVLKTWQDVQKQLESGEAAIEFVDFKLHSKQWAWWTDTTMYAALLLRPGMLSPVCIPLFNKRELTSLLQPISNNTQQQVDYQYSVKGKELYSLIWQKLEKELEGVQNVYYAPSGLLHKIAFAALPTDDSTLLSDKYNLSLVSSTREIARLKKEQTMPKSEAVVYGGLYYDTNQEDMLAAAQTYQKTAVNSVNTEESDRFIDRFRRRDSDRGVFSEWKYLSGTKDEATEIVGALNDNLIPNKFYTENAGNEESFKLLSGGNTGVLHLATHGFFLPDIENEQIKGVVRKLSGNHEVTLENPLLRSGLILSGANNQWEAKTELPQGIEDGILTADEISRMNLTRTKLVVLSACETGLGDIINGEGVFGLQRAFKLAGVESLIMSLWKVPDEATAELMKTFYQQWLSGKTKQEAFQVARQKVREKYKPPYFWAAFVLMD